MVIMRSAMIMTMMAETRVVLRWNGGGTNDWLWEVCRVVKGERKRDGGSDTGRGWVVDVERVVLLNWAEK